MRARPSLAVVLLAVTAALAQAGEAEFDIDSRFRAKIAKEKVKQAGIQRVADAEGKGRQRSANCGAQSIGNVDGDGRIGSAPREVFVFAPNAINLVSAGGCR